MYLLFASLAILSLMISIRLILQNFDTFILFGIQLFFSSRTCHLQQSLLSDLPAELNANSWLHLTGRGRWMFYEVQWHIQTSCLPCGFGSFGFIWELYIFTEGLQSLIMIG